MTQASSGIPGKQKGHIRAKRARHQHEIIILSSLPNDS